MQVVAATLFSGLVSTIVAGLAGGRVPQRFMQRIVFFATGVLLATALFELLPRGSEALGADVAGKVVLISLVGFLLFSKFIRAGSGAAKGFGPRSSRVPGTLAGSPTAASEPMDSRAGFAAPALLLGDGVHNFVDGVLIAAAFLESPTLGWAVAAGVALHELPQEFGDYLVLVWSGMSRGRALLWNGISGLAAAAGGITAWFFLQSVDGLLPYAVLISAASFLYVSVVEIMPAMEPAERRRDVLAQGAWLFAGVALMAWFGTLEG